MRSSDCNRHVDVVASEVAESVIFASRGVFGEIGVLEYDIVVRFEVEGARAVWKVPLEHQSGHPSDLTRQLHDHLLEDSVTLVDAARTGRAVIAQVLLSGVPSVLVEVWHGQ